MNDEKTGSLRMGGVEYLAPDSLLPRIEKMILFRPKWPDGFPCHEETKIFEWPEYDAVMNIFIGTYIAAARGDIRVSAASRVTLRKRARELADLVRLLETWLGRQDAENEASK